MLVDSSVCQVAVTCVCRTKYKLRQHSSLNMRSAVVPSNKEKYVWLAAV